MLTIYQTDKKVLSELKEIRPDSWIHMVEPTEEEVRFVSESLDIEMDLIYAATDEEERSRVESENGNILILVDSPIVEEEDSGFVYNCLPVGIILTDKNIITVCLKDVAMIRSFYERRLINFSTKKRNRFLLQLLYRNATMFLNYLKQVDKASVRIESELHKSMKNKELIQMLKLEKSLVYFSTSLKSNEVVMEKLLRMSFIREYSDDTDLLEDVIVENKQAIEMCTIYRDVISGTMDAFASVISNNLNIVMKLLTSITIILTIPTLLASLWGMNVPVPFGSDPYGFVKVGAIAAGLSLLVTYIMIKRKML